MNAQACPACLRPVAGPHVYLKLPRRWEPLHPVCGLRIATGLLSDIGGLKEAA